MLGADGFELAMMAADSDMIQQACDEVALLSQMMVVSRADSFEESIKGHISDWRGKLNRKLSRAGQNHHFQQELDLYQRTIALEPEEFLQQLSTIVAGVPEQSDFRDQAQQLASKDKGMQNPMFPYYFCEQWYQSLESSIRYAQQQELEESKEKLIKELYQRITAMRKMDHLNDQGEEGKLGRLWDMASSNLTKGDIGQLRRYAKFLSKHKTLQELAEKLGRMAGQLPDREKNQAPDSEPVVVDANSDFALDDITGIKQGDNINTLLPNESMFLAYPELEVVFYKHLVDKRLLNYKTAGKSRTLNKIMAKRLQSRAIDNDKGPFVICIDASGSMNGFPEMCAKAMAYALMQIALAEQRECYVILFSTTLITYELTKQDGLREISDFLSYKFSGGTDLDQALLKSLEVMSQDKYRNADLAVISDFIAPPNTDELVQQVEQLKAKNNRFHSVCLSRYGNTELIELFDHQWAYHPSLLSRLIKR